MSLFNRIDKLFDRIYSSKYNPLYQSGVLAIFLIGLVTVTGTYLVFFYKIDSPYESIESLHQQVWAGRWIRSLHHYAADAAVGAALYHWLRIFVQKRIWGPRLLAWVSGLVLLGTLLFSGLTGLMLVWDGSGKVLLTECARLLDFFPFFSEPISSAFDGAEPLSRSFFFLTLFIHVSMPLGLVFLLWLHTSKLARPNLLPPKALMLGATLVLFILSLIYVVPLGPKADAHLIISRFSFDAFYTFWLPLSVKLNPVLSLMIFALMSIFLFSIPWIFKPKAEEKLSPSFVHEKSCTGCTTCYNDCPFEAIDMVPRTIGGGSELVAHVNPDRCVSCGICSAACDPMGVGPPGRTGRDQIKEIEKLLNKNGIGQQILILGCEKSLAWPESYRKNSQYIFYNVHCAGGIHTGTIEYVLKKGIAGVFIVSCPPRNCSNREGPKWLHSRLFENHESSLSPLVDKNCIRLVHLGGAETKKASQELDAFVQFLKRRTKEDYSHLPEKECDS